MARTLAYFDTVPDHMIDTTKRRFHLHYLMSETHYLMSEMPPHCTCAQNIFLLCTKIFQVQVKLVNFFLKKWEEGV